MFRKKGPIFLLIFLLFILIFVIGVRYGQTIERVNKFIDYLPKLTPAPSPTPAKELSYLRYHFDSCSVSFVYPSDLTLTETSGSARFSKDNQNMISLECMSRGAPFPSDGPPPIQITFQNKKIAAINTGKTFIFNVTVPKIGKVIRVSINKELLPLFDSTLTF